MSSNLRDPNAADPEHQTNPGLDPDELRAEQAGDLPDRDAMSIIGVGGLEVGLPPAGILDGVLESDIPVETLPVDGLPVEHFPIDRLPIDRLPVEPLPPVELPVDTLPVEPPVTSRLTACRWSHPSMLIRSASRTRRPPLPTPASKPDESLIWR
jgi:hypothetical protein